MAFYLRSRTCSFPTCSQFLVFSLLIMSYILWRIIIVWILRMFDISPLVFWAKNILEHSVFFFFSGKRDSNSVFLSLIYLVCQHWLSHVNILFSQLPLEVQYKSFGGRAEWRREKPIFKWLQEVGILWRYKMCSY